MDETGKAILTFEVYISNLLYYTVPIVYYLQGRHYRFFIIMADLGGCLYSRIWKLMVIQDDNGHC